MFKINEFMINVPDRKKYVLPSRIFDFNVHSSYFKCSMGT